MEILADESVDFGIILKLRNSGIPVKSISEDFPGSKDQEVLELANSKKFLLITEDKDFGELTHRLKLPHKGILLMRLSDLPRLKRIETAVESIQKHLDDLKNSFSVLTSNGLRIKKSHDQGQ